MNPHAHDEIINYFNSVPPETYVSVLTQLRGKAGEFQTFLTDWARIVVEFFPIEFQRVFDTLSYEGKVLFGMAQIAGDGFWHNSAILQFALRKTTEELDAIYLDVSGRLILTIHNAAEAAQKKMEAEREGVKTDISQRLKAQHGSQDNFGHLNN